MDRTIIFGPIGNNLEEVRSTALMPVLPLSGKVFAQTCLRRVRPMSGNSPILRAGGGTRRLPMNRIDRQPRGLASLVSLRRENFVDCTKRVAAQKSIID
jgi:hypothetical protein